MPDSIESADNRIRLGVSSCLLGNEVRYDGGHKRDRYLTNVLSDYVDWVPICPEVDCGLPTPRESMRLVESPDGPRLVGTRSGTDFTEQMITWREQRLAELANEGLMGFVFKKDSPSSGAFRVKLYNATGMAERKGSGLFAARFMELYPYLPVEEEGRLNDGPLRENFLDRIFTYMRFTQAMAADPTPGGLVRFHTSMKMICLAHSPEGYRTVGQIVAQGKTIPWDELYTSYRQGLMDCMKQLATRGRHANVLSHLMGYLRDELSADDKSELVQIFDDYRLGLHPLIVPITMLKHHFRRHGAPDWVSQQAYLNPYPKELMLRNLI